MFLCPPGIIFFFLSFNTLHSFRYSLRLLNVHHRHIVVSQVEGGKGRERGLPQGPGLCYQACEVLGPLVNTFNFILF